MKKGLLICTGEYKYKNIGDFIQSIAAQQFYNQTDILIEREKLNTCQSTEKIKIILNGWFMWNPKNWPPSDCLYPLITSLHIVPQVAHQILSPKGINYLKKYSPIGCRDTGTMKILQAKGIDCYFSGCLTLTLGLKYKSQQRTSNIIFTDPYYDVILRGKKSLFRIKSILKNILHYFKHKKVINQLWKQGNFISEFQTPLAKISQKLNNLWCITAFYTTYRTLFSDEILLNAEYITHNVSQSLFKNDYDKLSYAENLLKKYSTAHMVITSRIHCGLPCLGVETPVLFVNSEGISNIRNEGRFGGLLDLFYVINTENNKLTLSKDLTKILSTKEKITSTLQFQNKPDYLPIKEKLIEQCQKFMQE